MTKEELQTKTKAQVMDFIRTRLRFKSVTLAQLRHLDFMNSDKEHRRFEMSGYDYANDTPGQCVVHNTAILNRFADLGIYDYTTYLFLDFYKGLGTLYYQYWREDEHRNTDNEGGGCLGGVGTTEIIYEIFQLTIFSGRDTRRRD